MLVGAVILIAGLAISMSDRIPLIGRLPGDFTIRGDGWTVYAPLATSVVLSLALTLALSAGAWLSRR
ncbi:MAG: DUF2905 domain-containing protein [Chloroflexi bacterium]|nr:MAG: DUF2905 domain-containing protein [Chloroflexota bacterium]TMC27707.1 MAG: DUF2905 domain-containing protein [Chloroflexota bacterium]TMC35604.1 MAG: DUF2905 domain-containing protein [Chloroflexota bacterium]TMC53700.1 MAG: DUF2905 domain-containing protein [Chloroflexota bacterium]TME42589.1 MAG: DUF2905 domain-containing protein [Chloroflexota bacterium]